MSYNASNDPEVYQKCMGIARTVDNFSCSLNGPQIILKGGNPAKAITMDTVLFFTLDANEIINMLNGETQ
jgi:hypothetical protein|tara:strand:+ start:157 stop:366 length:210 start_codon:yes stop_codon:yes gene_type:complete